LFDEKIVADITTLNTNVKTNAEMKLVNTRDEVRHMGSLQVFGDVHVALLFSFL
jgi:hypothetical protein